MVVAHIDVGVESTEMINRFPHSRAMYRNLFVNVNNHPFRESLPMSSGIEGTKASVVVQEHQDSGLIREPSGPTPESNNILSENLVPFLVDSCKEVNLEQWTNK